MSDWSQDISKAPRGQMVPQEQQRRGEGGKITHVIVEQFVPEWIWASIVQFPFTGGIVRNRHFTHWQPLPAPPVPATLAEQGEGRAAS